jgi:hypothetical protein
MKVPKFYRKLMMELRQVDLVLLSSNYTTDIHIWGLSFFFFICFWQSSGSFFIIFSSVTPHRGQPAGGNPPDDWQSALGWDDAGFEPGTEGQQSGALPLSHHASLGAFWEDACCRLTLLLFCLKFSGREEDSEN